VHSHDCFLQPRKALIALKVKSKEVFWLQKYSLYELFIKSLLNNGDVILVSRTADTD